MHGRTDAVPGPRFLPPGAGAAQAGGMHPVRWWEPVRGRLYALKRWMYRGDRPGRLARALIRLDRAQFAAGRLSPARAVTLEVVGRHSGRTTGIPLVMADLDGAHYLVSMLGEQANWVQNVRAAGGRAVLVRGGRRPVLLREVEPSRRAPILRRYLDLAPGARPHVPVDRHAPPAEFERIADRHPVFEVLPG